MVHGERWPGQRFAMVDSPFALLLLMMMPGCAMLHPPPAGQGQLQPNHSCTIKSGTGPPRMPSHNSGNKRDVGHCQPTSPARRLHSQPATHPGVQPRKLARRACPLHKRCRGAALPPRPPIPGVTASTRTRAHALPPPHLLGELCVVLLLLLVEAHVLKQQQLRGRVAARDGEGLRGWRAHRWSALGRCRRA